MKLIRFCLICPFILFVLTGCVGNVEKVSRQLLGTIVTVSVAADPDEAESFINPAFAEIETVQKKFNPYDPESGIFKINKYASTGMYIADEELYNLIKKSLEVSEKSGGAFDITFASTGKLWDFSSEIFSPPGDDEIRKKLSLISYRNIVLNNDKRGIRFIKRGTRIGMGAVAKGYAVQKAVSVLRRKGVHGAIVACAGDIQVIGDNHGRPWKAGIQDPRGKSVIATFVMRDGESVSTSGDYERFRIVNGRRYHHIIDPSTGYPADSGLISVTVFSRDPVISDAYSTAFFVAGLDKTKKILSSMSGISAVLVDSEMKVFISAELENKLRFREDIKVTCF